MKIKRIISIILCIATLFSALSLTAFAEEQEPYAAIKFRNPEIKTIEFGKTEELYLEYNIGDAENYKIEWEISKKNLCKIEYITDEATGLVTGAKLTGKNFGGDSTLTATIIDENGTEIVSAKKLIRVVESKGENKTLEEKLKIILWDSYLTLGMTVMYVPILAVFVVPLMVPYYAYLTVKTIIFGA